MFILFLVWILAQSDGDDPSDPAMHATFWNYDNIEVSLWWEDHKGGIHQGDIAPERKVDINTYIGHKFFFTAKSDKSKERLLLVVMQKFEPHYYLYSEKRRKEMNADKKKERQKFLQNYYKREGRPWVHYWPRPKPIHFMYDADFEGQTWQVESNQTRYVACPEMVCTADGEEQTCVAADTSKDSSEETEVNPRAVRSEHCEQSPEEETIELEVELICDSPRAYRVRNLLSDYESDQIIGKGFELGFKRSTVADTADVDPTRTSETVWIERQKSKVVDRVTKRIADIIKIDEKKLDMAKSAETIQLVKYQKDQYYNYHHDYGTDRPNSRYITFLMYLNTPEKGGETAFREAHCFGRKGPLSHPAKKGEAMFFYNLLPDGNADTHTLHSGTHVREGEKFMTNLWIWDPVFS